MKQSLLPGLFAASALLAGCTGGGAVFHHRDSGVQDIGPAETNPPGGSGGGGSGGGGTGGGGMGGGGAGGTDPWFPTVKAISAGRDYLVAAFPIQAGVIVVRQGHIEIVSRDGASLALITTPRDNVSASFDGTQLVVADRAMLTAYDTSLTSLGETPVGEACHSMAALSSSVVCTTWYGAYPFRSYVPRPGGAQTHSPPWTTFNAGIGPLYRVPGREQILMLDTGSFNQRLLLYDVSASGVVPDTSGSVGTFFVSGGISGRVFAAFDRTPAQRLMTDNGKFFRIGPPDCVTADPQNCLVADGALTPRYGNQEIMLAMVGDGAGHILVLRTQPYAVQKPICALGCALDSIDAATGAVDSTTMVRFSLTQIVSAEYDSATDAMVLGYRAQDGDRVSLLDFSPHTDPVGPGPDPGAGPAPIPTPPDSPPSGCAPGKRLFQGQKIVLTAAPVPGGLILARYDALFRMDRAGNVLSTVTRAQPSLSAVFDAGMLAVGDAQGLAFYDQSLQLLRQIPVTNGCQGLVFLSANRVVCDSRDPIYTSAGTLRTYAVDSGALLATSPVDGMWAVAPRMRRVPGVEALVNESNYFYLLYGAASDGAVSFVNTSPMQGMYLGGLPFTFWGSGRSGTLPVHLVSWSGSLIKIYNPDCLGTGAPFDAGCFIPDGEVGTLRGGQWFAAMVTDGQDLYTVTMDTDANLFPPSTGCAGDCLLAQHIDIPSRRVISSRMNSIPIPHPGQVVAIQHDAECGMLLVASFNDTIDPNNPTVDANNPNYAVDLVDYGGP